MVQSVGTLSEQGFDAEVYNALCRCGFTVATKLPVQTGNAGSSARYARSTS